MKFNWSWVYQESFLLVVGIIAVITLFNAHKLGLPVIGFIYALASIVAIACFGCVFATVSIGETYYKYYMIDKESFQSHVFKNMLVLSLDDIAHTFTYKVDEIHALKEIKAVAYYNIKKKEVRWRLIPYQQLSELNTAIKKAVKSEVKAQRKKK
jgi:hypothetical protein